MVMRFRAKVDNNQKRIVAALRKAGMKVLSLAALGKGVPDLLVYNPVTNRFCLLEVKNREWRGKLTEDQRKFQQVMPFEIVYDEYAALHAAGARYEKPKT